MHRPTRAYLREHSLGVCTLYEEEPNWRAALVHVGEVGLLTVRRGDGEGGHPRHLLSRKDASLVTSTVAERDARASEYKA